MTRGEEKKLMTDVALLKQSICGNGVLGLNDRVKELEKARSPIRVWSIRAAEATVIGAVLGLFDFLIRMVK